jgi:hypothetical protein
VAADQVSDMNLRAIRAIETRLANMLGEVSAKETTQLLALELSEIDESLNLVGALAATGAVAVVLAAKSMGRKPEEVVAQIRTLMAPQTGDG